MTSPSKAEFFKGQNYGNIRRKCVRKKALFIDSTFPPAGPSLFFSRPAPADIVWKRPQEIADNPKFFIDKASADDFAQGVLGNCWFVAACACLVEDSSLWKKVVPDYQAQEWLPGNKYAGIFHFKFWQCGRWVDVVIDDYLPTRNGRLIFLHSKTRNEFWSALLEKAYAKLFGCYEALTGGKARDAMVDMTGGVGENLETSAHRTEEEKQRLFELLHKAMAHKSLMAAAIQARTAAEMETRLRCGLVKGHAYSVTDVAKVTLKGTGLFQLFNKDKIHMVRLRNPWGGVEWNGPWSDGAPEWKKVSESEKKELGLTFDDNGEFWMSFDDFYSYFTSIDICHMMNTSFFSFKKMWREAKAEGAWRRPRLAGGCGNHASFLNNPQYILELWEDEEEVLISLEQKDRRAAELRGDNYCIGVSIQKTDLNRKYRMHDKLERLHAGPFIQSRSTLTRVKLPRGRYLVVPSTFDPGQETKFLIRVFTNGGMNFKELLQDEPSPPSCVSSPALAATAVTVAKLEFVRKDHSDNHHEAAAYCVLLCEDKEVRTSTSEKSDQPKWRERATFYRRKPDTDINIEVWVVGTLKDSLLGSVELPMSKKSEYTGGNIIRRYDVMKSSGDQQERTGFLWLTVKHTTNFMEV